MKLAGTSNWTAYSGLLAGYVFGALQAQESLAEATTVALIPAEVMGHYPLRSWACSKVPLRLWCSLVQQGHGAVAPPDHLIPATGLFKVSGMLQERERLAKAAKGSSEEGEQAAVPAGLCHRLHNPVCSVCLLCLHVTEHLQCGSQFCDVITIRMPEAVCARSLQATSSGADLAQIATCHRQKLYRAGLSAQHQLELS